MKASGANIFSLIYEQWQKFSTTGNYRDCAVRSQILASWIRCHNAGVDPGDMRLHRALTDINLKKLLRNKEKLICIAKPFMANLYKFVQGSGFVVVLTDEQGYIMEVFSDDDSLQNSITKNFFQGASWREEEAGTNAIGTALEIGEPIQVSGAEHYCQKHHCLTCSAAPLFDSKGKIIGILNMSGASQASHLHTLGMVVAAAEAIMAQMSIQQKNCELAIVNNRLTNFFNTVSDGVVIVDKDNRIIQMNPAAQKIFDKSEQQVLGIFINDLFEKEGASLKQLLATNEPYTDVEIEGTCSCLASREPIINEQDGIIGGIILLRPIKRVKNLVNCYSGNYATFCFSDIVGDSVQIREVIHIARQAAVTRSNVLIQGESGTGKEMFVQAIHNSSTSQNGPFIALNCGAIPRELIDSELFGYDDGAFTGAKRGGKPGKFELASGGTLFLDEIGDMPLEEQTALLRVIQERKVARIGSDKMIPVNVRLICATNKNLSQEVERGTFRHDLFYRLNVLSILLPPLRHHIEDLPLLFKYFLEKLSRDRNCKFTVESTVVDCLMQYAWPGNIRELQNVVERAVSLAQDGVITLRQLPPEFYSTPSQALPVGKTLPLSIVGSREQRKKIAHDAEKNKIIQLLNIYGGNVSQVARVLEVSRKTLYNKIRLYTIQN
ncbi:transcriptional regulator of acetoin/glycerol metabolism [Sporomusaceae bacterium BoRhaA]|uniref:sigma-54-dependent Fis family transcriptional regulator n=1 Tax=Pelorhabdus rhamnosifermentans TaxID=2772457 RepID=UPI001FE625C2|nr:sigma-54-dependent Fis family transcriptional regulator [Pelorhabdus rhamnosifermentans]MBU2699664.1 transcriptional regulator of acetoin/glycerol metabolism [Pelorhabdus rhamnosifermentans]